MTVRPIITLLFLVTVLTVLLVISIFFPKNGLKISEGIVLNFVDPADIISRKEDSYTNVSEIIEKNALLADTSFANLADDRQTSLQDTQKVETEKSKESLNRLQFPDNDPKILYPFFVALKNAANSKKPVRILHYGDSQIEGDRISSYLRYKLQTKFGGMGIGLLPPQQLNDAGFSVSQKNSENWHRYTLYGKRDANTAQEDRYGALATFCRFTSISTRNPNYLNNTKRETVAWVSFSPSYNSYSNTKIFQQCRVFYGNNTAPFLAEAYLGDNLVNSEVHPPCNSFQTIRWTFDHPVSKIKIVFNGTDSPDIYGIALDGLMGVALDNIAMRGSSGLIFTRMNEKDLKDNYLELNVKMVILQFGGNTVPNITNDYSYYEKGFYSQLKRIREIIPDITIIVIGVADMSVKENDRYVSYPNLEKVRDALKNATFKAHGIYWDMFEAMGGRNSMPGWVFAKPPLASKDFVHFNVEGSKVIAQMFYSAILYDYELYEKGLLKQSDKSN